MYDNSRTHHLTGPLSIIESACVARVNPGLCKDTGSPIEFSIIVDGSITNRVTGTLDRFCEAETATQGSKDLWHQSQNCGLANDGSLQCMSLIVNVASGRTTTLGEASGDLSTSFKISMILTDTARLQISETAALSKLSLSQRATSVSYRLLTRPMRSIGSQRCRTTLINAITGP